MDIKPSYSRSVPIPKGKAGWWTGEIVADNFKMGLDNECGSLMHDNLWNSFVTLLSALSPGHFRWCWTARSPQRITGDLPLQITHPQPARILFMQRSFLSERLHSLQIRLSCCSGAPSKAFANLKPNWSFLQRGVWRILTQGPAVPELQAHIDHRTHPSGAGCTLVPLSGDFFEERNGNDPLVTPISLPCIITLKFCCEQWWILIWAKNLTSNTTGPTVRHLLSCCTSGGCWAANVPFYSMK